MSDVWQGPGWWLASDGKWYPADAEPGAVYDGELASDDNPSAIEPDVAVDAPAIDGAAGDDHAAADPVVDESTIAPAAAVVAAPAIGAAAIAATEPEPVITGSAASEPAVADIAAPEVTAPDAAVIETAAADSMPDPIVESTGGGWQAIGTVPEPEPEPDLEAEAFASLADQSEASGDEDGWTSAFEERHESHEVISGTSEVPAPPAVENPLGDSVNLNDLAEVPPVPGVPTPDVAVPDVAAPNIGVPDVAVPEMTTPDVAVPDVAVPDMAIPDVAVPDVAVPDVAVPDVTVPDVTVPDVAVPDMAIPDVAVPDVAVPDVAVPDVAVPEMATPDVAVPDVAVPDMAIPDVAVPDAAVPDMAAPNMAAPDIAAPQASVDEVMSMGGAVPERNQPSVPIERQDAWRKPQAPDTGIATTETSALRGTPDVVDLAIPQDSPPEEIEAPSRNWRMWAGVLLALVLLGLIAWFIAMLFSGNSTTNTGEDDSSTTSDAVVETTETPSTESDEAADPSTAPDTTADTEAPSSTEGTQASVFDLRAGDCIVGDIGAGQVTKVEKVDCEIEHQFEVYREALIESSITTFDEEAISSYAEEVCRTSLAAYIPANDDRNLKFKFLQPTEDSWNQPDDPDRVITCLLFDGDDDPLIGRAN